MKILPGREEKAKHTGRASYFYWNIIALQHWLVSAVQ